MSSHDEVSDDDAPEAVSFKTAKTDNIEQQQKVKEQIDSIRESQKKKRIERQEKYIEQKKKKFDNLMLSDDVLDAIGDESVTKSESTKPKKKISAIKNTKKTFEEDDLKETTFSDFIPLKTFSKYGVSVVNLSSTDKKPLIASDRAKAFKSAMFNRGIKRQTAEESIALSKKRKLVK